MTVRTWFQAVHVAKYACHSLAASATDSPAGSTVSRWLLSGTLNAIVMIAPSTPKIAPASSHPLPGLPIWTTATTPTATASTDAPR